MNDNTDRTRDDDAQLERISLYDIVLSLYDMSPISGEERLPKSGTYSGRELDKELKEHAVNDFREILEPPYKKGRVTYNTAWTEERLDNIHRVNRYLRILER